MNNHGGCIIWGDNSSQCTITLGFNIWDIEIISGVWWLKNVLIHCKGEIDERDVGAEDNVCCRQYGEGECRTVVEEGCHDIYMIL